MYRLILLFLTVVVFSYGKTPTLQYTTFSWEKGATLLQFLETNNIPRALYYNLSPEDRELVSEIRADVECDILKDEFGVIHQVLIPISSELQIQIYQDKSGHYAMDFIPIIFDEVEKELLISVESTPSQDIQKATGSGALVRAFLNIYRGQIDDRRFRKGDKVAIIYRQKIRVGKPYGDPEIISAVANQYKFSKYLYLYESKYYDEDGKRAESFLFRLPLKGNFRVSSKFTPKRYHPILKKYRAHLGTDYAAPRGTPVYAAGDGKVSFIGKRGGYGNTVEIRHENGYLTLYAHLQNFAKGLKKGQKVSQGVLIAYVGTTGLSSGPHLHIGLYKNNVAIDFEKVVYVERAKDRVKKEAKFQEIKEIENKKLAAVLDGKFKPFEYENFKNYIEYEQKDGI